MDPLDEFAYLFLQGLLQDQIMELRVPKILHDISQNKNEDRLQNEFDFVESFGSHEVDSKEYITRKFTSENTMKTYTQMMAVIGLVSKLRSGK